MTRELARQKAYDLLNRVSLPGWGDEVTDALAQVFLDIAGGPVTLQRLSDCGLNPFAVKLLVESWQRHPEPKDVAFVFDGVRITIGRADDA